MDAANLVRASQGRHQRHNWEAAAETRPFRAEAISRTMDDAVGDMLQSDLRSMRIGRRKNIVDVDVPGLMIFRHDLHQQYYNLDRPHVFDLRKQGWHKLPRLSSYLPVHTMSTCVITGGGGLLCLLDVCLPVVNRSLYICNPLTKRWRKLPSPPQLHLSFSVARRQTTVVVDKATKSYKIVLFVRSGELGKMFSLVYFSESNGWRLRELDDPSMDIVSIMAANNEDGDSNTGLLLILFGNCSTGRIGMGNFDVERSAWTHVAYIDTSNIEYHLDSYMMWYLRFMGTIVTCAGTLYLVVPWSIKKIFPCTWTIAILKIQELTTTKAEKLTEVDVEFVSNGDGKLLPFSWFTWESNGRHFIGMVEQRGFMLKYDVLSGVWSSCRIGRHDRIFVEAIPYEACEAEV